MYFEISENGPQTRSCTLWPLRLPAKGGSCPLTWISNMGSRTRSWRWFCSNIREGPSLLLSLMHVVTHYPENSEDKEESDWGSFYSFSSFLNFVKYNNFLHDVKLGYSFYNRKTSKNTNLLYSYPERLTMKIWTLSLLDFVCICVCMRVGLCLFSKMVFMFR